MNICITFFADEWFFNAKTCIHWDFGCILMMEVIQPLYLKFLRMNIQ